MLDEEVADIAQVHCDSELFEIELSTSPSCVNVKGNLRRSLEFWKCIGTPSFIFNITEMGYLFPSVSFPELTLKNNRSTTDSRLKAGFHMIADDRESQIVDRRKFCDRL